ncbi:MAG: acetylesterase [Planctomycetota bacterium]|nr:MAG: acetylesterase [Planctomycetota bacterium]
MWQRLPTAVLAFLLSCGVCAAVEIPDFTRGDPIPQGYVHDWNLGPTGARGWMYCDKLVTTDARQILITKVEPGSPADGVLAEGDVILGVGGKPFSVDPRMEFGKAITLAETEAGGGRLSLLRWRDGKTASVVVRLPVLGTYSKTAPYDCPKSRRIFEQGCESLARRMQQPDYRLNAIPRCLNALALLASGKREYLPLVQREAYWAADFSTDGFQTWYYGYVMIFLAEYKMATGDATVMPGLYRLALEAAEGQSIVGSWGHKFAGPDGRLEGYGMMNSPGVPLTIGMILARKAGVHDPKVDRAIEKSARLIRFYVGKGAVPYGDHHPWIQTHEDNGKCGMAATMFNLLDEPQSATFFAKMSVASHGPERDCGHTGNFFNLLWAMPAISLAGPNATGAWMHEFGAWYFDLARRWDGSFAHQGPPQPGKDKYAGWDASGAYLLAYAAPLKSLYLTGKQPSVVPQLDAETAAQLIADGRGWSNKDRNSYYDSLDDAELLKRLGSWSPVVRERAGMALARRHRVPPPELLDKLRSPRLEERLGACQALAQFKGAAAPAVPILIELLDADDLWLRVKAADALAAIGQPAMRAVPLLLKRMARGPTPEDPRGMEQRYLCFALFNQRGGLLSGSLEGVDREALYQAVRAGLQNEDGRARGALGTVYRNLTYEELKPLLPDIYRAVVEPAPSGIMFADGIRLSGLELLAKHHIREGMPLCIDLIEPERWGKQNRLKRCLNALALYGSAAKPLLPRLRELEKTLVAHREARNLQPYIEQLRKLIEQIETSNQPVELRSLNAP